MADETLHALIGKWREAARSQAGLARITQDPEYRLMQDAHARVFAICADELEAALLSLDAEHR